MKTAFFAVLWTMTALVSLPDRVHASGAVTIEMKPTDHGLSYVLHKQGYGIDQSSLTVEAIEEWLRSALPKLPKNDMILVYVDSKVPFQAVVDLLRRFKNVGVEKFAVCSGEGSEVQPALSGTFDRMRLHTPSVPQPPK